MPHSIVLEYTKDGSIGVSKVIKSEGSGPKPKPGDVLQVTFSVIRTMDGIVLKEGIKQEVLPLPSRLCSAVMFSLFSCWC